MVFRRRAARRGEALVSVGIAWKKLGPGNRVRPVMQADMAECGIACLTMVSHAHGLSLDLPAMRRRFPPSIRGTSMLELIRSASVIGFKARALRAEPDEMGDIQLPAVLHWDMNHYVVLCAVHRHGYTIVDPARGRIIVGASEFSRRFTGVALELHPMETFAKAGGVRPTKWRDVTGQVRGLGKAVAQVLGLAIGGEILGLVLPLQMRWMVDDVLASGDRMLLWSIAAALALIALVQAGITLLRGWVVSWIGVNFSAQWTVNIFNHLIRLPMTYFERRHMGDVVSRFMSAKAIQAMVTGSFVEVVLHGLVGMMALVVMFSLFSPLLTGIVVTGFACYALLRFVSFRVLWRYTESNLVHSARQQSELMESVRGIQTIKLSGAEALRSAQLENATMAAAEQELRVQRMTTLFAAVNQGLFSLVRVLLIAFGAYQCLGGDITAGMFVAFIAYADQFIQRGGSLLDRMVDFRLLDLHAGRVADIVMAESELRGRPQAGVIPSRTDLRFDNVGFRYAATDPFVFRGLSFTVGEGESVAIVGPSGCGKTTLAKVLLGLINPTEGEVFVGDVSMSRIDLVSFRRMIGTVMQDDHLFAGTIAANVTFFDETAMPEHVEVACKKAGIHEDIMRMPMGYETLVGDMGSSLSGGQKQRILLARALYGSPKILVMDEATSHLDVEREAAINECIASMNITRIIIAHRESTIRSADRVVSLI